MEIRKERPNIPSGIKVLATCPKCRGKGQVPREVPFQANPKAPLTRTDRMGFKTCPRCNGRGRIGIE